LQFPFVSIFANEISQHNRKLSRFCNILSTFGKKIIATAKIHYI
jgi:hypothetical protein